MKTTLTIAGSDSSAGAGIQADLKTIAAHGVYGMSVITAVTAQNTMGVLDVQNISKDMISRQLEAIFTDVFPDSVKIGMLSNTDAIDAVYNSLCLYKAKNIVIDPIIVSTSGYNLLEKDAIKSLINKLFPLADLLTPNIPEVQLLTGHKIHSIDDMEKCAVTIVNMGCKNVLIKGGHLSGDAVDVLYDGKGFHNFTSPRMETKNTHGSGCTLSSSIASNLALGYDMMHSVSLAKDYISTAIEHSINLGGGHGPTNHFYTLYKKAGMFNDE